LFSGLDEIELRRCIASGELRLELLARDRLIETAGRAVLLVQGQVILSWFTTPTLAQELKHQTELLAAAGRAASQEALWRQEHGPLIERAAFNLTSFDEPGTLISLSSALGPAPQVPLSVQERGHEGVLALFTATPAVLLSVSLECLEGFCRQNPSFAQRQNTSLAQAARRMAGSRGAPDTVSDFFVRHGLSVATRLRVVDLTRCTGCRDCETACAERYGLPRLRIPGPQIGPWGISDTCRTCTDRRCLDACGYDAIAYDRDLGEVRIFTSHCVGCRKCSLACPYDAIRMPDLATNPSLAAWVEQVKPIDRKARGDIRPDEREVARRTQLASKCDHCQTHHQGQQACIAACQKDALLELTPLELFSRQGTHAQATQSVPKAARLSAGFAPSTPSGTPNPASIDERTVQQPPRSPLHDLLAQRPLLHARASHHTLQLRWLWLGSLASLLTVTGELILRYLSPQHTLSALWRAWTHGPNSAIWGPGSTLGLWLGGVGLLLIGLALGYMLFARVRVLRRDADTRRAGIQNPARASMSSTRALTGIRRTLGRVVGSLSFHTWAGLVGPLLVALHMQGRLSGRTSFGILAFWFMGIAAISGVMFRFFPTLLLLVRTRMETQFDALQQQSSGSPNSTRLGSAAKLRQLRRRIAWCEHVLSRLYLLKFIHIPASVLCGVLAILHVFAALPAL
jgi:Fe-S-cluster-containing hydrogenase component 2